jgi:maleamate amidohydrolase
LAKEESGVAGFSSARRSAADASDDGGGLPLHKPADMYTIIPELAPEPGEVLLKKSSPSPFFGTPLLGHLIEHGIDTLIVVGESTSGCVRSTVVDGHTHRFRMVVAEEGVFDREEASHAMNLYDMHMKSANVMPVAEVLSLMSQWGESNSRGRDGTQAKE